MGTVAALYRYPVKSMLGEAVIAVAVTEGGLSGDRVYAVLDGTGAVGSAKHPRKWGALLRCRSRLDESGVVRVVLPDGTALPVEDPELDAQLSRLLGRQVSLSAVVPEHSRLERAVPEYEGGVPEAVRASASVDATGASITTGGIAPGTFFDFGRVHLVTTASLARMREVYPPGDFDARRFRPNLVVDTDGGPGFPEDAWLGSRLRVGEALFRVVVPTPRCVVPTLGHDELPADPGIMRAVARDHRVPVFDLGRLSCLGVYLDVLEAGKVRVGDPITPGRCG
ncbi:MOSC domain-containing protein [Streptomyces fuscichromogenes]|uniref:Molybdenum cofactor biosysynthesis protein n=1 Tax=Streptomyces fuscichromogenes TaxID=1324013 RepID=A0A918CUW7_9ACTN|nr:MOSC domain-containing protein [Streptomyces fuscichromogenes]GGN31978.1 molybdenum cofactor biosysynthesis protein [Streptomyces fuscichromogenes]